VIAKVLGYRDIPTTRTVREWRRWRNGWTDWSTDVPDVSWHLVETHERTVVDPIFVVPQMLPCPNLGCDDGRVWYGSGDNDGAEPCETCSGSAVVPPPWPDYIATRQVFEDETWIDLDPAVNGELWLASFPEERRQVVAYEVTAIDELPVWNEQQCGTDLLAPEHICSANGDWLHHRPENDPHDDGTTERHVESEPWAASLTPGRPVWRLHLEALDQPCTHVVERFISDDPDDDEEFWDTAPLSVPVGEVADVELAPGP
jgi:hypothetical protein